MKLGMENCFRDNMQYNIAITSTLHRWNEDNASMNFSNITVITDITQIYLQNGFVYQSQHYQLHQQSSCLYHTPIIEATQLKVVLYYI